MTDSLVVAASLIGRSRICSIARYTLLEARRNRFLLTAGAVIILMMVLSLFVKQLAITESGRIQVIFLCAGSRIAMVFIFCIYVLQGLLRDSQDKILDLLLSFDMPRSSYILGKFTGHLVLAAVCAGITAIPLFFLSDVSNVAAWACSLAFELWIISAAAIFCITAFSQLLPAASIVLGFYLLARSVAAIQLMSHSSLSAPFGETGLVSTLADTLALLLPRLDAFTQSAWLIDASGVPVSAGLLLLQTLIFVALLLCGAMFDLHRRNL